MSGRVGDLSAKQEAALKQLRENVKDLAQPDWDDYYILRWLRARNFDVKKSEKMIRNNVEWRKKMDADNLLKWDAPEVLRLYYPGGYFGVDKEGYPIWIDTLGSIDLKGIIYSATKKDTLKYKASYIEWLFMERYAELSKEHGKRIEQCNLIFDMDGLGIKHLWKPAVDLFTSVLAIFEANYPETLKTCYVVNAPKIFPVMYNLAKPFLDDSTKQKIRILGKNWKKRLLEDIDPEQLPVHWGGTATDADGDEYCRSKICMGGKVPEKYRLKNIRENIDMSAFDNCTVKQGSSVQLDYDVPEEGSTLRWQFLTEGNDIGFAVYLRTADERQKKGDMEQIMPPQRVDSHLIPEEGSVVCEKPGTYVVRFDNSFSWVNSKKVAYLIEVLAPDRENELEVTAF